MDNGKFSSFLFRESWWNIVKMLPTRDKGVLLETICDYVFNNKEQQLDKLSLIYMAFLFIQRDIDMDKNKYSNIKIKRSLAGKKGNETRWQDKKAENSRADITENSAELFQNENKNEEQKTAKTDKSAQKSQSQIIAKVANATILDEQEKQQEILLYALHLLSQGRPYAYSEAASVYDYYDAMDWAVEVVKPNGDKIIKRYKNHVAFLKAGTPKNEQLFSPADGDLMANIISTVGCNPKNKDIIDCFRGFRFTEEYVVKFIYTNIKSFQKFQKAFDTNSQFNHTVSQKLQSVYKNATSIDYEQYKS